MFPFPRPDHQDDVSSSPGVPLPGLGTKPYVTWGLLAVIAVMHLIAEASGGSEDPGVLRNLGAMDGQGIAAGESWRLFAAMFLHSGWMHLGLNCFGLFIFGQQLEQLYGRSRFTVIYVLAGLAGSVTSYALSLSLVSNAIGVGASGAVFGVLGGLVAFFLTHRNQLGDMGRRTLVGLLVLAGVNLLYGLVTTGVDNYAHIGGFVCGVVLGVAFSPRYLPIHDMFGFVSEVVDANSIFKRWWALPAVGVVLVAGVLVGDANVGDSPVTHLRQAKQYRLESNLTGALQELDRAIEIDPTYGSSYLERAVVMAELGNFDRAISDAALAARFSRSETEQQLAIRLMVQLQSRR